VENFEKRVREDLAWGGSGGSGHGTGGGQRGRPENYREVRKVVIEGQRGVEVAQRTAMENVA
jgi:hypothetical protein